MAEAAASNSREKNGETMESEEDEEKEEEEEMEQKEEGRKARGKRRGEQRYSACRPDCPECRPVIIYLPDELLSDWGDTDSEDGADDESDDSEAEGNAAKRKQELPPRRNGQVKPIDDPALELLLQSIQHCYEPNQPDMLDRMIAMFNSGRQLGPEGEAQMKRLRAQRRRRERHRRKRLLDPSRAVDRRGSMAQCFCSVGRLLSEPSASGGGSVAGKCRGSSGGNGLVRTHETLAKAAAAAAAAIVGNDLDGRTSPTSDIGDEAAPSPSSPSSEAAAEPTAAAAAAPEPPRSELRIEITPESLDELGHLFDEAEEHFRRLCLGVTRSPVVHVSADESAVGSMALRWRRHLARQSERRRGWELQLERVVGETLEGRLAGFLYEPLRCSRLVNLLASDLLDLVMGVLGDEFKIVGLLSIGGVTAQQQQKQQEKRELDTAMATRSSHCRGVDTCKVFHYENESVYAVYTCHLFQRFSRKLEDSPLDSDEWRPASSGQLATATGQPPDDDDSCD